MPACTLPRASKVCGGWMQASSQRPTTLLSHESASDNRHSMWSTKLHEESEAHESIIQHRADRLAWAAIVIVTLVVFALYVRTLDKQSLVFEEGLSVIFASRPLPQLMRTLIYEDLHPPLHYLLLHFWMILAGNGERAVRMPSALAALLLTPLAWAIVMEVWGQEKRTGARTLVSVAAAALVGASPFVAFYAQENRMYSLVAALALAATWAFLRATRTGARRWWLTFSCLLAASLYTQYMAFFVVPAFWLYVLLLDRKSLRYTALYTLLAGLLYLPWIGPAYLQLRRLLRWPDYWVTTNINLGLFLQSLWDTFLPSLTMRWGLLIAGLGALLLIRLVPRRGFQLSGFRRRSLLVVLILVIPLALTYTTVALLPKFVARYTIVAAAPFYICAALALYALLGTKSLPSRALFGLVIIVAVTISLRSTLAVLEGRENQRDDTRGLAAYLTENGQANDALLLMENAPYAFQYYYRGTAPWHGLHVGQNFAGAASALSRILQTQPRRVWLILWHHEFADPTDMTVTELMRVGREVDIERQFHGYQLRAFDILEYETPVVAHPQPETAMDADFWPGIHFLGFDRLIHDNGQFHYVLYWQAQEVLDRNYSLTLSFQDQDGNEYLRQDQALSTPYFLPPVWPLDTPIRGRVDVTLPADLPPITYQVYLQVLDPESQRNLDLVDENGILLGQALLLEELALPKSALGPVPVEIKNPLQADTGNGLRLLGFDLARSEYLPGDTLQLTLWWRRPDIPSVGQSLGTPGKDQSVRFRMLCSKALVVWESERALVPGYPASEWQAGEINRAVYRLAIPSDLESGEYTLQAGTANRLISLTSLNIIPRQQRYDMPPMQQSLGLQFEEGITLLGYDLQAPAVQRGETITVTLYWQTKQQLTTSYKVSVQMLTTDLRIVAQDDSIPVRWTYPTTAWSPGEIITDEHVLTIMPEAAPGSHTLITALYDEQAALRLGVEQAGKTEDHATLTVLYMVP
jgi:4-amino-4-deoxy-L-arabinose transferase-like glycosyltransferase